MIERLDWVSIYPQILLVVMTCVIALVDLLDKGKRRDSALLLSILTLLATAVLSAGLAIGGRTIYAFSGAVVSDKMANWLTCFACIATLIVLVYSRTYVQLRGMLKGGGEWYVLNLLALLGTLCICTGNNLLVLYLGLELLTLSSYALVALRRDDPRAVEAAMKYFVLGSMASGFLLYGLSMIYGATGSLDLGIVFDRVASLQIKPSVLVFGLVFVVAGVAFKIGAAPFHMWLPDVYHGAPTAVTLSIGAAPKLAAFALALRLLVSGLLPLAMHWQLMLYILAVVSLLVGNLAAIAQSNLKRMLAYSTIAQMGFVIMGLLAGGVVGNNSINSANAYSSAMFYVITYVLTTLVSFGVIVLLSRKGFESEEIEDLAGLNRRSPWLAAIMALCMFSLAGIPPLVGFQAKMAVLQALLAANQISYAFLVVFAVIMSAVGAFYYIRVVKVMYFDEPKHTSAVEAPNDFWIVLSINALLLLLLGIMPGSLLTLCAQTVVNMLPT